jgi:uncharacterized protein
MNFQPYNENIMKTIKAFIKSNPLLCYYILVFAISWGGILVIAGGPSSLPCAKDQIDPLLLPVMVALFAGPSVTGLLMIGLVKGKAGFRDLFSRMTKWRVELRWYIVALLAGPLLFTAASLVLSLFSSQFLPALFIAKDKIALLIFGISYGLIGGGILEELGWTGFAVPTLRSRYSIIRTGLIAGILWGAWHFMVIYWMSDPNGVIPLALLLPIQLFSWLPAYRVLMVWVYERSGESMLIAIIMHANLSASMLILQPQRMEGISLLTYILTVATVLWLVTIAVIINNRRVSQKMIT